MKKFISSLVVLSMLLGLVACGNQGSEDANTDADNGQGEVAADYEKPYEGNVATLPMKMTSSYDDEAEQMRQDILNLPDSEVSGGFVYYISPTGNDDNDGKSPETAWKTAYWLDTVEPASTVLFERGGVYRGNFAVVSGATYGAYGEGPKPAIYGSLQNYADPSLWTEFAENVWEISVPTAKDIGNIVFDHGAKAGVRVFSENALDRDYAYLYANNAVYLFLSTGNPGEVHEDIELSDTVHVIRGIDGTSDVTIENLCIKYGAAHGISFGSGSSNIVIRGCEIGYIGGGAPEPTIRYGNGIEFWRDCSNITVENCWVYQCYDAGITHQASSAAVQTDIKFHSNLIEYCQYNIEFFNENGTTKNVSYKDNVLRFAGYQVFDPKDRRGSNSSMCSLICTWRHANPSENFVIENNVLDTSYGYLIAGYYLNTDGKGATVSGNTYIQQSQMPTYFYEKDSIDIQASVTRTENDAVYIADSQSSLEQGVSVIDKAPASITFE